MTSKEGFAPSVVVDGRIVTPPGWMWVLGFALSGCEWALKTCETSAWQDKAREWCRSQDQARLEQQIEQAEKELIELREELCGLKKNTEPIA